MAELADYMRDAAAVAGLASIERELDGRVCDGCPAAQMLGSVRGDNVPGVRCRIEHNTLSLATDPRTILRWCSQPAVASDTRNGYVQCPTWRYEKQRIWAGQHSLGDRERAGELDEATWREDLTGSPHGDLSVYEEAAAAAEETVARWQQQQADRMGR
jgi:hypothetical protein